VRLQLLLQLLRAQLLRPQLLLQLRLQLRVRLRLRRAGVLHCLLLLLRLHRVGLAGHRGE
jgi:hypothetical protein